MSMSLIIAGGRDHWLTTKEFAKLDAIHVDHDVTEVICGMAPGVDSCGYAWATMRGIEVTKFPADWERLGRRAGPTRNVAMAVYARSKCGAVALFSGGFGTQNMAEASVRHGLTIFDFRSGLTDTKP
jgi:hypothetical protein